MRAVALLFFLFPTLAHADVSFEVADHGDSVEVIAHGLEARSTTISSIRSRLEIPLVGNPIASRQIMSDPTVLQVELDGVSARVLSIKTRLDRSEVRALAPLAKATQVGSDLHMVFPRHATAPVPAATKPAEPKIETKSETKPDTKPDTKINEAPKAAATIAPPALAIDNKAKPPEAAKPIAPAAAKPTPLAPATSDNSNLMIYGAGGLLALVAGMWLMRNRKKQAGALSSIDIVAQRALGNKAKVMWLAAGERELLVAVTNQQVRMLGQWPRTQTNNDLPRLPTARISRMNIDGEELPAPRFSAAALDSAPTIPASNPVAGLLKLRQSQPVVGRAQTQPAIGRARTMQPMINEDVATEDADADLVWAKEILAATGGRR